MKKYDETWHTCNNLLSFLRASKVVDLVRKEFAKFDNDAPPELIQKEMDRLQEILDKAKTI